MKNSLYCKAFDFMLLVGLIVLLICVRRYGNEEVQAFLESKFCKTLIALIVGVIMYYTPDEIDKLMIAFIAVFGIMPLLTSTDDD